MTEYEFACVTLLRASTNAFDTYCVLMIPPEGWQDMIRTASAQVRQVRNLGL